MGNFQQLKTQLGIQFLICNICKERFFAKNCRLEKSIKISYKDIQIYRRFGTKQTVSVIWSKQLYILYSMVSDLPFSCSVICGFLVELLSDFISKVSE